MLNKCVPVLCVHSFPQNSEVLLITYSAPYLRLSVKFTSKSDPISMLHIALQSQEQRQGGQGICAFVRKQSNFNFSLIGLFGIFIQISVGIRVSKYIEYQLVEIPVQGQVLEEYHLPLVFSISAYRTGATTEAMLAQFFDTTVHVQLEPNFAQRKFLSSSNIILKCIQSNKNV